MTRQYRVVVMHGNAANQPLLRYGDTVYESYTLTEAIQSHPRLRIVGDQNPNGADDTRARLEAIFSEHKPDVVAFENPASLQADAIALCAKHSVRGIISDIPLWESPADLALLRNTAENTGLKAIFPHFRRCMPAFRYVKARYLDGAVGEPMMAVAGLAERTPDRHSAHWLDLFRFFHDDADVEWVFGQARVRDEAGASHALAEHAAAYCKFATGGKAMLDIGSPMTGKDMMVLMGTKGCIRIRNESTVLVETMDKSRKRNFGDDPESHTMRCWYNLLNEYVEWLDGGPEPELSFTNILKTIELHLAVFMSAIRGDRIDLPLDPTLKFSPIDLLAQRTENL